MVSSDTRSARIRAKLSHPVLDADGHIVECTPVLLDYLREAGGREVAERYRTSPIVNEVYHQAGVGRPMAERRAARAPMSHWWSQPSDTLERATVTIPRLLYERLDDLGVDFTILYPSEGLFISGIADEEIRRAGCHAYNCFVAEQFAPYHDRMAPVAVIPMTTPQEALEELDHAVGTLGLKGAIFQAAIPRVLEPSDSGQTEGAVRSSYMDLLALDSDHDYDAVWRRCIELGIAVTFHQGIRNVGSQSVSNYVYNHIQLLGGSYLNLGKALFLGGVTRRFPELTFGFLEGGVGWAASVFADLIGHWQKRNGRAIHSLDPARLDVDRMMELVSEYGSDRFQKVSGEIREFFERPLPHPEELDDFAACGIEREEDIGDLFTRSFYFGCEADDPINALAFAETVIPFGTELKIIFGSDIGHWDVSVIDAVLEEAYEPVEHGAIDEAQFRRFTFENAALLHARMNPDFFRGTRIEDDVAALLA